MFNRNAAMIQPGTWAPAPRRDPGAAQRLDAVSAERAVLGRLILHPGEIVAVTKQLAEDDFAEAAHRVIWRELLAGQAELESASDPAAWLVVRLQRRRGTVAADLTALGISRLTAIAGALRKPEQAIAYVRAESTRRRWAAAGAAVATVGEITDPVEQATAAAAALQQVRELASRLDPPTPPETARDDEG